MDFAVALLVGQGGRAAAAIWATLILLALLALAGLALPRGVFRPRQISAWLADSAAQKRAELERRSTEAEELIRYADEIAVAARGAAHTAERRREECQEAQVRTQEAWQAYQAADAALTRARRAAAYATPMTDDEHADRAQALRRSAQSAYRRGDLSDTQLLDALTHRNGWDPTLHPVEQELILARAAVTHRFAAYQECLTAEDAAWQAADIATASVRSLRLEVIAAEAQAESARATLPQQTTPARSSRRIAATA
ncbi:hypothetical protein [Actinoplanes friuliensis]|uniref:Nucleoporin n=1 Tax=Actinoplanes friuliensis DSM 7358 TaxID=1246995 RepID=U5VQB8_9ACTN|nr:hypothetical protein [Actinoplanes friuliensis]AGZ39004.1 nucleoporin [Actinoplanes friuliensis DSM 7358]